MKNTFKKEERLSSQKIIGELFDKGSSFSFSAYPFRLVWSIQPAYTYPVQVVISVSKRKYKHAVDRNRVKRLVREAYRKQKASVLYPAIDATKESLALMIIYTGNTIFTAKEIELKLNNALLRLVNQYEQGDSGAIAAPDKNI